MPTHFLAIPLSLALFEPKVTAARECLKFDMCRKFGDHTSILLGLSNRTTHTYKNTRPPFYPRDVVSAVYATATCLAGCLSVTRRYCIKTAKPILKLFQLSRSPIILVSSEPALIIPNSKRNSFSGGVNYTGVGKLAIFDRNRRLSRKRYEIGRWLLWNVNKKSWVPN